MAEAYYEPTPATDGATMNPVPGAVFQVFEIADTAFATPLRLRVGSGNPTTSVTASDTLATLPGVYVTSPNYEHIWKSGTFEWRRDSITGAKLAIDSAKQDASNSASAAASSADSAAASAALVNAPADTVMRDVAANPASAFATQLSATYAGVQAALAPTSFHAPKSVNWISTFQVGHGFTVENATLADDTTTAALGGQSVKLTATTAGAHAQITKTGLNVNTAGRHIIVWAKIKNFGEQALAASLNGNTIGAIELLLGTAGFGSFYTLRTWVSGETIKPALNGEWFPLRFDWAAYSTVTTGAPPRDGLTDVRLRFITSANVSATTPLVVNIGGIGTVVDESVKYPNGVVSFTFDDAYASHYTEGKKALDKYGYAGTAYVISGHFGSANRLTLEQARAMQNISGWEISGHSMTVPAHDNALTSLTLPQLEVELSAHKAWLRSNGFYGETFAYPRGIYTKDIIETVGRYFAAARGTSDQPIHNHPERLDPKMLTHYDASVPGKVAAIKTRMDEAKTNKTWLILTIHDINTTGGLLPSELVELVDYAASIGIAVRTVQRVASGV